MKKSVFFLTLLLCLSLILPGAHAEDTYVPGERMRSLVSSALEAGQLVGGEAHFSLTLPDSMLPDDEEGRAQFDALAEVIQGVSLAGGMGRLDDGYRVELGGAYTAPSGDNVYVTGAANLTADGLSLESNLIEGERLSIRWKTLLEMLGLSENEIDALLSLPTTDWDSALNELNDELAQAAETFGKLADPYLVTLADFAATLNIQQRRDVEAENGYPTVENEISITCTAEELSRLLHSLADQVEKDTALRPYLEQLIQNCDLTVTDGDSETTHVMSVSEFCDETRQFADVLAETPAKLYGLFPRKGVLQPGSDADFVVVDMDLRHTYTVEDMKSKCKWSPYFGRTFQGWPVRTVVRGKTVCLNGQVVGTQGWGQYIPRLK